MRWVGKDQVGYAAASTHRHLLAPGRIGSMELKNRMLVTAMGEANIPAAEIIEGAMRGAARAVLGPDAIPPL
jgi:hypothetical protein